MATPKKDAVDPAPTGDPESEASEAADGYYIDGKPYTVDDLTFRERRELRKTLAELLGVNLDEPLVEGGMPRSVVPMVLWANEEDLVPVLVWTIKRRTDPEYAIDTALSLKGGDLEAPTDPPKASS